MVSGGTLGGETDACSGTPGGTGDVGGAESVRGVTIGSEAYTGTGTGGALGEIQNGAGVTNVGTGAGSGLNQTEVHPTGDAGGEPVVIAGRTGNSTGIGVFTSGDTPGAT